MSHSDSFCKIKLISLKQENTVGWQKILTEVNFSRQFKKPKFSENKCNSI